MKLRIVRIFSLGLFLILLTTVATLITACGNSSPTSSGSGNQTNSPTFTATSGGPTSTPTNTPSSGVVTTLAGQLTSGSTNATGTAASFNTPYGVAVDSSGNVYVADSDNDLIREISPSGVVSTMAGTVGVHGATNATGTSASFYQPYGVAVDSSGNVYVADTYNNLIRKITSGGVVSTLAGGGGTGLNGEGSGNATGTAASFWYPQGVAVDSSGNVYVADTNNNLIRKITSGGVVTTLAGGGSGTNTGNTPPSPNSGALNLTGTAASFYNPYGVAVDSSGNVYVADTINNLIRKITTGGVVSTLAGSGSPSFANGTGTAASFYDPTGIGLDSSGNVYVADADNQLIRKITTGGVVSTFAGGGSGSPSINGTGTAAKFDNPTGIAVDSNGNVYVADAYDNMIRKIN